MPVRHRVRAADSSTVPDHRGRPGQPADPGQRGRPPRRRIPRRSVIVVGALIIIGILAFAGLLLVTPSVGNAEAIARVSASWLTGGGAGDQGGATIYQQLAKLLYTPGRSGAGVELEQVSLAVKLFMTYSSQQILQMYSEVAYFGNGDYGLAAASCGYFGIPPRAMSWPQAALLAGLVENAGSAGGHCVA